MKLRTRLLIGFAAATACSVGGIGYVSSTLLLNNHTTLDTERRTQASESGGRSVGAHSTAAAPGSGARRLASPPGSETTDQINARDARIHWWSITAACLLVSLVLFAIVDIVVLRRLLRLGSELQRFESEALPAPHNEPGADVLRQLALGFNALRDSVEANSRRAEACDQRLRAYSEELDELVLERTRQIEHQVFHDALTGLPNRLLLMDRLAQARSRSRRSLRPFAILFLDLDNFKVVNDSQGHNAGDRLLVEVARRLQECVRPGDTVARLGGDEFIVLTEDMADQSEAERVASRIAKRLQDPIEMAQGDVYVGCSIGIACSSLSCDDPDLLLRNADTAMYHVKGDGKGCYAIFDQSMNDRVVEQLEIESGLRRALENDEFTVVYQPIIDLGTGTISGVEALTRWEHPTRGVISPSKFIAIAEETGQIVQIGETILEKACADMLEWHQSLKDVPPMVLNVNLSGRQLVRSDIVEQVRGVLERTGLDPAYLKLEITESTLMEGLSQAQARLLELKSLGVKLAIDDFGTGYSSMASLSTLPVDSVKIDRSFVTPVGNQHESAAIIAAIIMISRTMNLDVTAEGIETFEQVLKLQELGCEMGQGFFFSRPLTRQDLEERLRGGPDVFAREVLSGSQELVEEMLRSLPAGAIPQAA